MLTLSRWFALAYSWTLSLGGALIPNDGRARGQAKNDREAEHAASEAQPPILSLDIGLPVCYSSELAAYSSPNVPKCWTSVFAVTSVSATALTCL